MKHTGIPFRRNCLVLEFWNIDSNKKLTISFCHILHSSVNLFSVIDVSSRSLQKVIQQYNLFTEVITSTEDGQHSPPLHQHPHTDLILKYWCTSAVALWLDGRIQLPKPLTTRSNQTKKSFCRNNVAKQDCIYDGRKLRTARANKNQPYRPSFLTIVSTYYT